MKGWRLMMAGAVLAVGIADPVPARAEFLDDAGWGTLTVLSNVAYMPAKVIYAALGGITGGFAYGLTGGDLDTANDVWIPALGGTYVLTPRMIRGEEPIVFAGMPDDMTASAPAAESSTFSEQAIGGL